MFRIVSFDKSRALDSLPECQPGAHSLRDFGRTASRHGPSNTRRTGRALQRRDTDRRVITHTAR